MLHTCILLNDFEAIGYGLNILTTEDLDHMIPIKHNTNHIPPTNTRGTCAIIGAGFGLGMSILSYDYKRFMHIPLASEGGHMDLIATDKTESDIIEYLKVNYTGGVHPDFERVLSGKGLENIYDFFRSKVTNVTSILANIDNLKNDDKLNEIENYYGRDNTCTKTLDQFMKFYAIAARNLALTSECYGGLYVGGRIANRLINLFKLPQFMEEFVRNDRKSDILKKIPVYVFTSKDIGLYGCANVAINHYNIF